MLARQFSIGGQAPGGKRGGCWHVPSEAPLNETIEKNFPHGIMPYKVENAVVAFGVSALTVTPPQCPINPGGMAEG